MADRTNIAGKKYVLRQLSWRRGSLFVGLWLNIPLFIGMWLLIGALGGYRLLALCVSVPLAVAGVVSAIRAQRRLMGIRAATPKIYRDAMAMDRDDTRKHADEAIMGDYS